MLEKQKKLLEGNASVVTYLSEQTEEEKNWLQDANRFMQDEAGKLEEEKEEEGVVNIREKLEDLTLSDSLESMLMHAGERQQIKTDSTNKKAVPVGPVSGISGIPINDRIRFERDFADEQRSDSKRMAAVRKSIREFFELKDNDYDGKIEKLKELIGQCDTYLAKRSSSRERGKTRRDDVLDVRAQATIRLLELDQHAEIYYPKKMEDRFAYDEKMKAYAKTDDNMNAIYQNITARFDVLKLCEGKKMDLAGYRDYASTAKNLLNRITRFSFLLQKKAATGGETDQQQIAKLTEISDKCNEILRGSQNTVMSEKEQEYVAEAVNGSDEYLNGLMDETLEKEKKRSIRVPDGYFYSETSDIYSRRTTGRETFYDLYLERGHGEFKDIIQKRSLNSFKTVKRLKHKEMVKEELKDRIKKDYPHNVAVALFAKLDQMVEEENKRITEELREEYQRDQEVYERTYLTDKPVKEWDEEDIKYLQMRDGESWVSDKNKNTKEFPLPAVHMVSRTKDLKPEIKTLVISRMKVEQPLTPVADELSKKMEETKATWSGYGRTPLRFYGRLCNLEMAAQQIAEEKVAVHELLMSTEGQAYKDELKAHIAVLDDEMKRAMEEISAISGTINSLCDKTDHKLTSQEEDILKKAELDDALTDTLMHTGHEFDKSQMKWTANTVAKAKTLLALPGLNKEYQQIVRSVIFALNEAETGNIPQVDQKEFLKLVDALEKVDQADYEKEEIPKALVDLQYYILNHNFSHYVRIDMVSSISEHQGKFLSQEQKEAIGDYITSSYMLNGYLRMGINVETNKAMEEGEQKEKLLKQRDEISKAIKKNNVKKDMNSFRGTDDRYLKFWLKTLGVEVETIPGSNVIDHKKMAQRMDEIRQKIVGKVYVDKGFTSTTTEEEYAKSWIQGNIKSNLGVEKSGMNEQDAEEIEELLYKPAAEIPGQHVMLMDIPAGSNAALIDRMGTSKYISQQELLVNYGSSWVVTDFQMGTHPGQYVIKVKLLKEGGEKKTA